MFRSSVTHGCARSTTASGAGCFPARSRPVGRTCGSPTGRVKTSCVPEASNGRAVRERAVTAVREHAGTGGVIVLCTHGGPALNLALWAAGFPPGGNIFMARLGALGNTSITTIEVDGRLRRRGPAARIQRSSAICTGRRPTCAFPSIRFYRGSARGYRL